MRQFRYLIYARYISESHRLYVLTLAQMGDGGYSQAFTWANYWFKNKTVYFGDWAVVNNTTLSSYFAALSRAVDELAKKWHSDKQYKPQAYPQISQALMEMSRATAGTDIDKPLGRGYALVTDVPVWAPLAIGAVIGTIVGIYKAVDVHRRTHNWGRAVACDLWYSWQTFTASFSAYMSPLAGLLWQAYRATLLVEVGFKLLGC